MKLFPMFTKLDGRRCLVVGAGTVGEGKIATLVEAGASVTVVAPQATALVEWWMESGLVRWRARDFESADLDGVFLAVVATDSTEVNRSVFTEAQRRGVLCNVVDVPELCDFYYPATVQRGNLQIAVSTGGLSPALAQRIRRELEQLYPERYSDWLERIAERRGVIRASGLDPARQRELLHRSVTAEAFARFVADHEPFDVQRGES